jgi:hypothetical protein
MGVKPYGLGAKVRQTVGIADILRDPINLDRIRMPKDTLESLGKPKRPTPTIQRQTSAEIDLPPPSILLVGASSPKDYPPTLPP